MSENQPNILLIIADELRADALGCFGNPICQTPNLDKLAAEGTTLSQCMVTSPTCTPSRASFLTGVYPSALRSRMVGCSTPEDPRFITKILSDQGYHTASIGKIHLIPQGDEIRKITEIIENNEPMDFYGFKEVELVNGHGDACNGPGYNQWLNEKVPNYRNLLGPIENKQNPRHEFRLPAEAHAGNYLVEKTTEFFARPHDRPFFLHLSFNDPHHPFTVPEPYASQYNPEDMPLPVPFPESGPTPLHENILHKSQTETSKQDKVIGTPGVCFDEFSSTEWQRIKAVYYGMTTLMDDQIGQVLDSLRENGLAENTYVIFISDHGDYLGDHGFYGKGLHYDSSIRTPVIISGPDVPKGVNNNQITSALDLAPTLLDFASVPEPEAIQGESWKEMLLTGKSHPRSAALIETDDDIAQARFRTICTKDWKMTVYLNQTYGELYDRNADPTEEHNLWDVPDYHSVREELRAQMLMEVLCSIDLHNGRTQQPTPQIGKWINRVGNTCKT